MGIVVDITKASISGFERVQARNTISVSMLFVICIGRNGQRRPEDDLETDI